MLKIGLITLFGNYNYGNRLQNYAVQNILEGFECEVQTIVCAGSRWKCLAKCVAENLCFLKDKKRYKRLKEFKKFNRKYLNIRYVYAKNKLIKHEIQCDYDLFFVGSDQVWNPEIRKKERNNFFLLFAEEKKRRCISPSIGVSDIPESYIRDYEKWLSGFKILSCREDIGANEISRITKKECLHLIDPTLVIDSENWRKLVDNIVLPTKPYILLLFLGEINESLKTACVSFATKNNYIIIDLNSKECPYYTSGPQGFLKLIDNATLVCTDSYHAAAFSINFNAPFWVTDRVDRNLEGNHMQSRIQSLLKQFDLESRYYFDGCEISNECDFSKSNQLLVEERKKFKKYVEKSLEL